MYSGITMGQYRRTLRRNSKRSPTNGLIIKKTPRVCFYQSPSLAYGRDQSATWRCTDFAHAASVAPSSDASEIDVVRNLRMSVTTGMKAMRYRRGTFAGV